MSICRLVFLRLCVGPAFEKSRVSISQLFQLLIHIQVGYIHKIVGVEFACCFVAFLCIEVAWLFLVVV